MYTSVMDFQISEQLDLWISLGISSDAVTKKFLSRAQHGNMTRDEDGESHLCVYFAVYDPSSQEVYMGHHKKSGLWLFNGGHIDKGETPKQALEREFIEELGISIPAEEVREPNLLTITPINNLQVQRCRMHYDVWYFIAKTKGNFHPEIAKYEKEFYKMEWLNIAGAEKLMVDPGTLEALSRIKRIKESA